MSRRSLALIVGGHSTCVHDLSGLLVRRKKTPSGAAVLLYGAVIGLEIETEVHSWPYTISNKKEHVKI
jgi:hypothetical protein